MGAKALAAQAKVGATWENGRTTKDGPGGALTPLFRGLTDQPLEGE